MRFIDEVRVEVKAGDGGRGCVSFLREKNRPRGGPNGGNGGDGGSVRFRVNRQLNTLLSLSYRPHLRAERGAHGRGKDQHGRNGQDLVVHVPPGTIIRDADSGVTLVDLGRSGEVLVAKGGRGGRGNAFFASSTNRAPRQAQDGQPGERYTLALELRMLAEVGLVGFPNAGKSTLLSAVSSARPRVDSFPFTTLAPHLGVVRYGDAGSFVMADIPGLVEGAHSGRGLGIRFLRHIARTSVLVHLVDISQEDRDPCHDRTVIEKELAYFDPALVDRPTLTVVTKLDLPVVRERWPAVREHFRHHHIEPIAVSAATGEGIRDLVWSIARMLDDHRSSSLDEVDESTQEWA